MAPTLGVSPSLASFLLMGLSVARPNAGIDTLNNLDSRSPPAGAPVLGEFNGTSSCMLLCMYARSY